MNWRMVGNSGGLGAQGGSGLGPGKFLKQVCCIALLAAGVSRAVAFLTFVALEQLFSRIFHLNLF